MSGAPQTIGLCMIVRDEAAVIDRCLESVADLIDTWTIVDTGSEDETPSLVERALSEVPGQLHRRSWRDFGANRTELMKLAAGTADYLLLLDADMTLESQGKVPRLDADAYHLRHLGSLDYAVPRLVRGDRTWRFEGSTHEYLATDGEFSQESLEALAVSHHSDSGTRGEKFQRDARLLERELETDPQNPRAVFYLAQTLRDMGQPRRATDLYRRRAGMGGYAEEAFYAAYQAGVLTASEDAVGGARLLLEAAATRPSRAEPLHELAQVCRLQGWHSSAYAFARRGLELAYPDDLLFVHRDVYEWALLFELSIAAYWVGRAEEALRVTDRLLGQGRLPPEYEQAARQNRPHCVAALERAGHPVPDRSPIEPLARLAPSLEIGEVRLVVDPPWPQYNPTIAADGDGFRMVVRTANYRIGDHGYQFLDGGEVIRTVNYLVGLDPSLEIIDISPITDESDGPPRHETAVRGLEDLRLLPLAGRWYALANARDRNPEGRAEMMLLSIEGAKVTSARPLSGPVEGRHEKNWMPFELEDGGLGLVYSSSPTVVFSCNSETGALERVAEHAAPAWAAGFRGGSQGLRLAGGTIFVVHEVLPGSVLGRAYVQRLVMLDEQLRLVAVSPRFSFTGEEFEYCAGLARRGSQLLMSFGVFDRAAALAVCSEDELLGLLEPVKPGAA